MLNSGSDNEPDTGRFTSITPLRSFSSDTASSTGSLVASGLSTRSPKVSWSRNRWLLASSLPFSIL
ncbi:hypothetical protein D3C81_2328440 [compost metagenome]